MENNQQSGHARKNIKIGDEVEIVQKQDQRTGKVTRGFVQRILTKSPTHPHGIKVELESGEVGRVKTVLSPEA
ncbi:MAG: YwbE family protein [Caldilineaceae bacterium]